MVKHKYSLKRIIVSFLLFLVLSVSFTPNTHAGICQNRIFSGAMAIKSFCLVSNALQGINLARTILDMITSFFTTVPPFLLVSQSLDDYGTCGIYNAADMGLTYYDHQGQPIYTEDDVTHAQQAVAGGLDCDYNSKDLMHSGSLIGVTKLAYNVTVGGKHIPLNMAYFFGRTIQKVPIVGSTALAQTATYPSWGLDLFYEVWIVMRDISYGVLALIMLFIGIMIITRKKISPQAVLTVQKAIPRIIISLVLIVFSYPIGAFFASALGGMIVLTGRVLSTTLLSELAVYSDSVVNMNVFNIIIVYLGNVSGGSGGLFSLSLIMGFALISIIVLLLAIFKIFIISFKILLAIVFSPLQFAVSSLPGQEKLVTDYFKQMLVRVLSAPAIFAMITISWVILIKTFVVYGNFLDNPYSGFELTYAYLLNWQNTVYTIFLVPLVSLLIMFQALKAPKKIEEFIMGPEKKTRR